MRPSKPAAAVAWVLVALIAGAYGMQLWPEHRDPAGLRSQIGIVR